MKLANKIYSAMLIVMCLVLAACSGVPGGSTSGGTGSAGVYTIGGNVTGLVGTGLILVDNTTDTLPVATGTTKFTFKNTVASGGKYTVTVSTQPSNPAQTCAVTSGSGNASANVTTVAVTCTTNPVTATISVNVSNLAQNSSLILQDNGGDSLTVTANGTFPFKTQVTGPTDAYAVTVLTQPTSPNQICTPVSGSGTATTTSVTVTVNCVLSYTIGGTVTGLVGGGFILQNSSDLEQLPISAANGNQPFTFKNLVPTGTQYTITIAAQPTGPVQTCVVTPSTASGAANKNVTNVAVNCPAVTYSVGGVVVGLQGLTPNNGPITDNSFVLQNVLGNTLIVPQNGPFQFATTEALNDQYQISVFHGPNTQKNIGCTLWDYKGVVTGNIMSIIVDCGHNDWTWINGTNTAGVAVPPKPQYGSFPPTAPTTIPNPFTNTPGARYGAAGWTDNHGSLFLFGGDGWELTGNTAPDTLDAPMNDLWVCDMSFGDYCQWQLVGGYDPTPVVVGGKSTTVGAQIILAAQHEDLPGSYIGLGSQGIPTSRLGATAWTDKSGNFWLFGGSDGNHFLNDLWEYNHSTLNSSTYTMTEGQWIWVGGSALIDQPGIYSSGTPYPGARTNAVTWTDNSGNLWLFGGYGYDGQSPATLGFLNDLWEYTGGKWVFVSSGATSVANQNGIYGTQGTAAGTNMPGGRQEAVGWADANGNLWLFGGEGLDDTGTPQGILNDLWVYNIKNNEWTWVMGAEPVPNGTRANHTGDYELQALIGPVNTTGAASTCGLTPGLLAPSPPAAPGTYICLPIDTTGALPGSRWGASGWTDPAGNFWLYGGWGLDSTATNGNGALDDLWVYTPNATAGQPGTWVWVKGSNTGSQNGIYGPSLDRPYLTYYIFNPGGRSNATHWVDGQGQLWLFGGEGYDSTSTTGNGYLNDLWRYLPYPD